SCLMITLGMTIQCGSWVPAYTLGRTYRDCLGWANQRLARDADRVILMVAGLPVNLKALALDWPE
ncbi:bifunctional adenosylcobinamide kinase/adenosylcobinamide-phosphate guanylyltransferase, partial [Chloroflexota bacterium]